MLACSALADGNKIISSFDRAKEVLPEVFKRQQTTIYCGCDYDYRKDVLGHGNCERFQLTEQNVQIQWEHIVPASFFGKNFEEWSKAPAKCREKGLRNRQCARKYSAEFRYMEADLHNLAPAIDLVNGLRSNYPMREIQDKTSDGVWLCQLYPTEQKGKNRYRVYEQGHKGSLYLQNGIVEPQAGVRGRISRAYLYMAWAYPSRVNLTYEEWVLYHRWNEEEPPNRSELKQHKRSSEIQGNVNPFIAIYENNSVFSSLQESLDVSTAQKSKPTQGIFSRFSSHVFPDIRSGFVKKNPSPAGFFRS
ncbi:MAG: endonuclease [Oligoflexales bacterium]